MQPTGRWDIVQSQKRASPSTPKKQECRAGMGRNKCMYNKRSGSKHSSQNGMYIEYKRKAGFVLMNG